VPLPHSAQKQELVARFADAFERGEVEPLVELLTEDAWLTMPPNPASTKATQQSGTSSTNAFAGNWDHPHRLKVRSENAVRPHRLDERVLTSLSQALEADPRVFDAEVVGDGPRVGARFDAF
jgi:hypothetical protein